MVQLSDNVFKMDYRAFYKAVFRIWSFLCDVFTMMISFIYMIFIVFIYVDFIWYKCGIMWLHDIFLLWIFSFLLRYIHINFIWLTYNWLVIDLFLSDCSIIMVLFFVIIVLFFCELLWFIVSCFLVDILINIIVCNALYYNGL